MSPISIEDYFGPWIDHPDATPAIHANAETLLVAVNAFLEEAFADGIDLHINPATKTYISGKTLGGFRPQDATQGSAMSSHKEGRGVDVYDPHCELAEWAFKHQDRLAHYDLYIEHPSSSLRWLHCTNRAPKSHKRVFYP
jgi:hypothetical protein